jgi:hypothetical protein
MSMEDILKILVDSRQPGSATRPAAGRDPMTDLIGGLLGGQAPQTGQAPASPGLSDMMGILETILGAGRASQGGGLSQSPAGNPIMGLLQPVVNKIAQKMNISPEIAMLVVTFVVQKLLAHHPTSGRDSTQFDLDDMLQQMSSGNINPQTLQSSGMVDELAQATGLDHETAARSLDATLGVLGGQVAGAAGVRGKKGGRTSGVRGARGGKNMKRPGS